MCFGVAKFLLLFLVGLTSFDLRAEWKTETMELVPGWNAIFVHVDPSQDGVDVLLQRTPVSQVWLWAPTPSATQFVSTVQGSSDFGSNWISWVASDPTNSNLQHLIGNAAYLVYVDAVYNDGTADRTVSVAEPYILSLKGKVIPPSYIWTVSGQNFLGFSNRPNSEPTFVDFFGLSDTLDNSATEVYEYPGGELGVTNPALVISPLERKVKRGQAYWVKDSDYNRFFGTFSVTLQDASGVHFDTSLTSYRIRLTNTANEAHTVTLELVASEVPADGSILVGAPPLLVRGDLDPESLSYGFANLADAPLSWNLAAAGEVGASVEIVLGIDRVAMASNPGDAYAAILRFTDSFAGAGYTQIDLPATAITPSLAGLWVGEASITQVKQDLAAFEVDDDGGTLLGDDGAAVVGETDVSYGAVARNFPLRLIMHMADDGTTQLLQRVYYGLNEDALPILATGQNVLNSEHLDVARRITAVHLPWSGSNTPWSFDSSLSFSGTLSTTVATFFDDHAANPFVHTYHPDHDNRSPLFEAYGQDERGFESFDIEREITLNAGTAMVAIEETTTSPSAQVTENTEALILPSLPSGVRMVDLPNGSFVMGNEAAVGPLANDHKPERLVYVSPFEISEAEITVQQYVDFLNSAWADGLITVSEDSDGSYVVGASGQPYEGHKLIELSGSRVLKDHDGDGDIDPENPLNQCWIEFDGSQTFSVKDPAAIDWSDSDLSEPFFASEWTLEQDHIGRTIPTVVLDGDQDSDNDTFDLDGARSIAIDGNIAFVACEDADKVLLINISDPSNPNHIRTISDSSSRALAAPYHLNVHDGWLYVTSKDENAVTVFDISRLTARSGFPSSFTYTVSQSTRGVLNDGDESGRLGGPRFSTVYGDYLYIGGDEDRIVIFDITNMTDDGPVFVRNDPVTVGGITYGNFTWLEIVDGVGYLASNQQDAILVLDYASNPTGPGALSVLSDGDAYFRLANCFHLLVNDNVLYVSSRDEDAVTLIDVSDPSAPTLLKELRNGSGGYSLNRPLRMAILNDVLFVPSNYSDSITMVDISDPASPVLLETVKDGNSNYSRLNGAHSILIDGEQIYVTASSDNALNIISPFPAGETLPNWPELTDDLPTQSEVATWPATFIKWHGAKSFAEYYGCDLPTEAQWEYAAKGGSDFEFSTSDGSVDASKANYNEDNLHPDTGHAEPVKSYSPNPFGLYDMAGNVWEWCRDWYDAGFYSDRPDPDYDPYNETLVVDPTGEPIEGPSFVGGPGQDYNGDARVKRGGSWNFHETSLLTSERERDYTWRGNDHFGFRIVREQFNVVPLVANDFSSLSSSATKLSGVYQERITLKGKNDESREYSIAGEFDLIRISDIDTLRTE